MMAAAENAMLMTDRLSEADHGASWRRLSVEAMGVLKTLARRIWWNRREPSRVAFGDNRG